jgi:hypothetical protein
MKTLTQVIKYTALKNGTGCVVYARFLASKINFTTMYKFKTTPNNFPCTTTHEITLLN